VASQRRAGQHRKPKPRNHSVARSAATVVTAAATMSGVIAFAGSAGAAPAPTTAEFEQVKQKVNQLTRDAIKAGDEANGVQEKVDARQQTVTQTQNRVAEKQSAMNDLRDQIGQVAAAQYRSGGMPAGLQLAMSEDPQSFLNKAQMQGQLDGQQADKLRQIASQTRMLQQDKAEAGRELAELETMRKDLTARKTAVQGKLNEAQKLLDTLTEQQRQAVLDSNDHEDERTDDRGSRGNERETPKKEAPKEEETAPPANASGKAAVAMAEAMRQQGKPYVLGANGPGSFDCSSLMKWSYAKAGISLPRTTWDQVKVGKSVPKSALQPGDLVFFYSDISHVGMYIGNGNVVHAPRPGKTVRVEKLAYMPFYGARRVA
jgi:cell wall-associated NlpC family hydrolase